MSIKVGFSKTEIPCFFPGLGMMGYGQPHNFVKEQATPIFARALIFEDTQMAHFIFINIELAFVSIAVKEEVTKRVNELFPDWDIDLSRLMITAQHTHSAPGGYSHYPFYNFTIPGFRPKMFEAVVSSIVTAISEASKNISPSILKLGSYHIPEDNEVAFNRSMSAYLNNKDIKKIPSTDTHLGVNRQMLGLNIYSADGKLRAHLNWFGVHATSISSFNHRIHHDNKGIASDLFEKMNPGSMAIFAQAAAGDVSPNYIWDKKLKRTRGKFPDQYESAAYNGELQASAAQMIQAEHFLDGKIQCSHLYHDLVTHAAFPAHGISFFEGTLEGPGIPKLLGNTLRFLSRSLRFSKTLFAASENKSFYESHGAKDILLDHRTGEFIGIPLSIWKKMPVIPDPTIGSFIKHAKNGSIETTPWVPPVLPYQIVTLGDLAIIGVPGEITTISAERLKNALKDKLNVSEIIISSYANAYMGYVTTPEEYDLQCYEGGHTVYGRYTLPAMIQGFIELAEINQKKIKSKNDIQPFRYPAQELERRTIK